MILRFLVHKVRLFVRNSARIGTNSQSSAEDLRKAQVLNLMSVVGFVFLSAFGIASLIIENWSHSILLFSLLSTVLANWVYLSKTGRLGRSSFILISLMAFLLLGLLRTGGEENTGLFWFVLLSPLTLFLTGVRKGSIIVLGFLGIITYFLYFDAWGFVQTNYSAALKSRFLASNLAIYLLTLIYEHSRSETFSSLRTLSQKFEQLSQTDPLTNLLNRRGIQPILDTYFEIARRNFKAFSVLVIDIDHFKVFNDLHGHDCGDEVLVAVSQQLRKQLRSQDAVARWGGEEFLVFLPETNESGAKVVAEKLRKAVEALKTSYNEQALQVTISCGGITFKGHTSLDSLILEADHNLIQAKQKGRNCSIVEELVLN